MDTNGKSHALPTVLADHPWRVHTASLASPPQTMLMQEELNLLHWLTSRYYKGEGLIVDGGCFLGGSTYALAAGLAKNPTAAGRAKLIHTFDMFSTAGELWYDNLSNFGLRKDQSFEDIFRRNLSEHLDCIEVHAGRIYVLGEG